MDIPGFIFIQMFLLPTVHGLKCKSRDFCAGNSTTPICQSMRVSIQFSLNVWRATKAFSVLHSFSLVTAWLCNFGAKNISAKAARKMQNWPQVQRHQFVRVWGCQYSFPSMFDGCRYYSKVPQNCFSICCFPFGLSEYRIPKVEQICTC